MEDNSFIIDSMTWSFSRINSFYNNCRKEWKEKYVECMESFDSFDGQAGGVAHKVLEKFFKRELTEFDLAGEFEKLYDEEVTFACPYPNGDTKYTKCLSYFENFNFPLDEYEVLGVEKKIKFKLKDKYDFVGFIDVLLKKKDTGEIILMDHKSSTIKRLKNGNVSKSDQEHWEAFKRQQYLYSYVIQQEYGNPSKLVWNMFKDGEIIEIDWKEDEMNAAIDWAYDTIQNIENETVYPPLMSFYYCANLCSRRLDYCPYKRLGMIYDGIFSKCYSVKNAEFFDYGAQGIEMCEEWKTNKLAFCNWAIDNGFNDEMYLKRIDEGGNFTPDNCYWEWKSEEQYYGE